MADVFISYKSEENELALSIKRVLESNGFSCWKAPESIPPASDYTCEITDAITECKVAVLVLSEKAQNSRHIQSEIRLAFDKGKPIIPFHIDTSDLNKQFDYYLSNSQRVEAFKRLDSAYNDVLNAVIGIVRGKQNVPEAAGQAQTPPAGHRMTGGKPVYRLFFGIGQRYTLFFYSADSRSKEDPAYYNFTEEDWNSFSDAIAGTIAVIMSVSPDMVSLSYKGIFGEHACAPLDGYNYHDTEFRSEFGVNCLDAGVQKPFDSFHVDTDENTFSLSLYNSGSYADCSTIADTGIDEDALINAAKNILTLCVPESKVICGSSFRRVNSVFKLSYIKK